MTLFPFQDLWCNIVGCSTDCSFALTVKLELGCKTEVADFDFHLVVEEQITELEISVDHSVTVKVLDSGADLVHVALDLQFMESLPSSEQLVERLILAQLEQNIDVLGIFEEVLEANDVVVVEGPVDLDLRHEFLLGSCFGQSGLRDNFGRRDSLVFEVCELKAARKSSLAKELTLEVPLDADFSIVLDDFLLDDGLGVLVRTLLGIARLLGFIHSSFFSLI